MHSNQLGHTQAKNQKMGKKFCPFKYRFWQVTFLLFCLALCPQMRNQTLWFQTNIINMHVFSDLDFFIPHNLPPQPFYVHVLLWWVDCYSLWGWGYLFLNRHGRIKELTICNMFWKHTMFSLIYCLKTFSMSQEIQGQSIGHLS